MSKPYYGAHNLNSNDFTIEHSREGWAVTTKDAISNPGIATILQLLLLREINDKLELLLKDSGWNRSN